MPLMKISCPECNANLKTTNPNGFKVGVVMGCPKCEATFNVSAEEKPKPKNKIVVVDDDEEDVDDDENVDDQDGDGDGVKVESNKKNSKSDKQINSKNIKGKKKSKSKSDKDGKKGYRNSPIRYIVLGLLLLTMIVMGVFLLLKWKNQADADKAIEKASLNRIVNQTNITG